MFEKIRKLWNKFWYGSEIKQIKVGPKEIQKNVVKIQRTMEWLQSEIETIVSEMDGLDRNSEDYAEEFARLNCELKAKNDLYSELQKEQEQEYATLKKMKESRFSITPKDAITIGGLIFLSTFAIALERENPKAIKLVSFITKMMPLHI